jgi:hypothetical protein
LVQEEFRTDIAYLGITKKNNASSIFNNLIIDMNKFEIVSSPPFKTAIVSKLNTFSKYTIEEIDYEYSLYKYLNGLYLNLSFIDGTWKISNTYYSFKDNISVQTFINHKHFGGKTLQNIFLEMFQQRFGTDKLSEFLEPTHTHLFLLMHKSINIVTSNSGLYYLAKQSVSDSISSISKPQTTHESDTTVRLLDTTRLLEVDHSLRLNRESFIRNNSFVSSFIKNNDYNNIDCGGLMLISKNGNENRIIYNNNFYKLDKLIFKNINRVSSPASHNTIEYIILKNILKYRLYRNDFFTVFSDYLKIYKKVVNGIERIVEDMYSILFLNLRVFSPENGVFYTKLVQHLAKNKKIRKMLLGESVDVVAHMRLQNDVTPTSTTAEYNCAPQTGKCTTTASPSTNVNLDEYTHSKKNMSVKSSSILNSNKKEFYKSTIVDYIHSNHSAFIVDLYNLFF